VGTNHPKGDQGRTRRRSYAIDDIREDTMIEQDQHDLKIPSGCCKVNRRCPILLVDESHSHWQRWEKPLKCFVHLLHDSPKQKQCQHYPGDKLCEEGNSDPTARNKRNHCQEIGINFLQYPEHQLLRHELRVPSQSRNFL
jgi:hypothetical protein